MSLLKIMDINVQVIRKADSDDFVNELIHEIEEKLASLDGIDSLPYNKPDIVHLIGAIEIDKMKCLRGQISAKRLYRDVDYALSLFKIKNPKFDYLKDPAFNAYFYEGH
jgi:hypothetical protein